jgi:hypothetical protein
MNGNSNSDENIFQNSNSQTARTKWYKYWYEYYFENKVYYGQNAVMCRMIPDPIYYSR